MGDREPAAAARKLTAILSVDVVGYSRLMAHDELATIEQVKTGWRVAADLVQQHGGRVVDDVGDNLLADLPSVVEAVRCAVALQREFEKQNSAQPEDRRMQFRIGVNLGDVVVDDERLYGDGVNVAARVQALAEPGAVAISGTVFEHVCGKLDLSFEDLGEHEVKNIPTPIRVYRVHAGPRAVSAEPEGEGRGAIAVLPFENMSGDPEQEYFADGIAEDLITRLIQWRESRVIARNSSFAYKGQHIDVKRVGSELGARFVVEGSVRRSANRVRITAQLIHADTGHHLWGEKYDRELDDIFQVQDEISSAIADALTGEVWRAETRRTAHRDPASLDAWDSMLRASWHAARSADPEQAERAKRLYERAIELDPELATAWAFLATMHHDDLLRRRTDSREESLESLLRCAQRAISLDDQNSVAHLAMAFHHNLSGKPGRALASVDRAVELAPGWEDPRRIRAQLLSLAGDVEGAIRDLETAARLSPKNARFNFSPLALAHFSAGHYEEAVRWGERALESDPTDAISKGLLVASYAHAGRLEEARELGAGLPGVSEEQLRSLLSSATEDFVDRMIAGLRRAGWRG